MRSHSKGLSIILKFLPQKFGDDPGPRITQCWMSSGLATHVFPWRDLPPLWVTQELKSAHCKWSHWAGLGQKTNMGSVGEWQVSGYYDLLRKTLTESIKRWGR